MAITDMLFELQDIDYADFQSKLIPGIDRELFIGVRVPLIRKLAKELCKEGKTEKFLAELPHQYYDEDILHGLIIAEIQDYDDCLQAVDVFLPYINNWAVCDIITPKVFSKNKALLLTKIREWSASSHIYTCRFGIKMLMSYYLELDFKKEYLEIPANIKSDEYYVKMMIAWFFATALAKQWDDTVIYLENNQLDSWTHNKTIQKSIESLRITKEQKKYLRTLKRKQRGFVLR